MTQNTIITILVTPKSLRAIASSIEERMEKTILGDWVPSHSFYSEDMKLEVKLVADQTKWHNKKESQWS
jgi:hypothetical protein